MIPSLLFCEQAKNAKRVSRTLVDEIRLSTLLSDRILDVICQTCGAEDILLRQDIFRAMEQEDFCEKLLAFSAGLHSLNQACQQYKDADSECERLLAFSALATRFCTAVSDAGALDRKPLERSGFPALLSELIPIREALLPRLEELHAALQDIYTSRLLFNPVGVFLQQDIQQTGLLEDLAACARDLEICDINLPSQRTLAMPPELSAALLELYPQEFTRVRALEMEFSPLPTDALLSFRDEITFYTSVTELVKRASQARLPHCYPKLSETPKFCANSAYDIALLEKEGVQIIPNDIKFEQGNAFCFLTGANGGGKTTYIRCVAANLILAAAGCPVFATDATVFPFPFIGGHFPIDETAKDGRLAEEQIRVDDLLRECANGGFLFFNETFSGANDKKGLVLTLDCAENCTKRGIFALFVTHFHEVVGHGFPLLWTLIDTENENRRTYKIVQHEGLKSSYAEDILKKYHLSADTLHLRGGK